MKKLGSILLSGRRAKMVLNACFCYIIQCVTCITTLYHMLAEVMKTQLTGCSYLVINGLFKLTVLPLVFCIPQLFYVFSFFSAPLIIGTYIISLYLQCGLIQYSSMYVHGCCSAYNTVLLNLSLLFYNMHPHI